MPELSSNDIPFNRTARSKGFTEKRQILRVIEDLPHERRSTPSARTRHLKAWGVILLILLCLVMTLCSSKDKGSIKPRSSSASPISNEAAKADHHYKQALLLRKEKRYPEAVNAFKEAIRLRPNDPCIYHNLAHNYEEMGVLNEALAAMNQAVSLGSSDANHLVCRGRIFMKMQQTQNAIKDLRAAVEIKPDNAKAHHLLGHAYERAGNMKEALNNLKRSLDLEPGNKGFLICYENLQKKMGKS